MADFVVEKILSTPSNFQEELCGILNDMRQYVGDFDYSKYRFIWFMSKSLFIDISMNMPWVVKHTDWYKPTIIGIDVTFENYCPGVDVNTVRLKAIDIPLHERPIFISTAYNCISTFNKAVYDYMRRDAKALKDAFERNFMAVNPVIVKTDKEISELLNFNVKDSIKKVIFNEPATIVHWNDGTKTVVKCSKKDTYSKETGLAVCIVKKITGNKGNYNDIFRKWIPKEDATTCSDYRKEELIKLRGMASKLRAYCNRHICDKCLLEGMSRLSYAYNECTGYSASNEELLDNKDLIIAKYEALMKEEENK